MPFLGELAALATATFWAGGSLLFTVAARRAGSFALNAARLTAALLVLTLLLLATRGLAWAPGAGSRELLLLGGSGLIGLTLGDWGYFSSMVAVGPRLTTLLMTLAPPLTALLAVPILHERIGPWGASGMILTLAGVVWVIGERMPTPVPRGHRIRGVILGVAGSFGQALGLVLSKLGMGEVVDPLPATAIRMAAATAGIWILVLLAGKARRVQGLLRDPIARSATLGATILGPVLGIWLSLVAVRHTQTGIAATLMATTPLLILPLVRIFHGERISRRAVLGAMISVVGVAVLVLR
jgi:drug/metabolite transporter (DMT)-like permease